MVTSALRKFVLTVGVLGSVLFLSLFALSYMAPTFVERTAKDIVRYRLQVVTQEKVDALGEHALVGQAQVLINRYEKEVQWIKQQLMENMPQRLSGVIEQMRDPDCACRVITAESIIEGMKWRLGSLAQMQQQLTSFIQAGYMNIVGQLTREFRIFTGSSGVAFLLLVFATVVQKRKGIYLLLPAGLLFLATVVCAYFYIFQQNWLHTILFSSYVGLAYLAYIGFVFIWLCDVVFNRARVTRMISDIVGCIAPSC